MISAKWEDLGKFNRMLLGLSRFSKTVEDGLDQLLHDLTEEGAERLKNAILNNQPELIGKKRFRQISKSWRAEKARNGWNLTPLNRTGSYARAIFTKHEGGEHKITLPSGPYEDGERSYKFTWGDLARWLEMGTRSFRAIKHWKPTREWILNQFRARMRKVVLRALFKR